MKVKGFGLVTVTRRPTPAVSGTERLPEKNKKEKRKKPIQREVNGAILTSTAQAISFGEGLCGCLLLSGRLTYFNFFDTVVDVKRGNSSVVERDLAKVDVAGPTPVSR
jgi:hypothetical protein